MTVINVQRIHSQAQLPTFGTKFSTGADLRSTEAGILYTGEWKAIGTGLKIAANIVEGSVIDIQIRPRSGLAYKNGVTVLNSPGTIDQDYRGEVKVILINLGNDKFEYEVGDRIAQMVVAPFYNNIAFEEVKDLDVTERNEGGFGSTGIK